MNKDKKKLIKTILAVIALVALVVGAAFAYFMGNNSASGTTSLEATTEEMGTVIVNNPTENLYLRLASKDMEASKQGTSYYFTETDNTEESNYSIGKENNILAKYSITGGSDDTIYNCSFNLNITKPSGIKSGDMSLKLTGIGALINGIEEINIDLLSASDTYTVTFNRVGNGTGNLIIGDLTFNNTTAEQNYMENASVSTTVSLNGLSCSIDKTEEPDLFDGTLTPVVYDGENWKIVESTNKDWYDYENQEWANAVILENGSTKAVGDTVAVDGDDPDILAMYVWIPRYEYRIQGKYGLNGTSTTSPGEIEVNFISKETTKASDGYMIHPSFTFGGEELSGIWVGKFEVSHTSKTTSSMNCTSETCAEANNLRILPNTVSLRSNSISSFYYGIKSMEMSGNVFGINGDTTDSHMMKNSEWGAVAYLSQSKFGKYGNDDYSGSDKEVYINNSSDRYTGRSGGSYSGNTAINTVYTSNTSTALYNTKGYYTYDGFLLEYDTNTKTTTRDMKKIASTTGNITGIYDMSGGAWEFTMGVFANSDGDIWSGGDSTYNSGFSGKLGTSSTDYSGLLLPDSKYYEIYKSYSGTTINSLTACNNGVCFGDAIDETHNWYSDDITLISADKPWFTRGGEYYNPSKAGIFDFANHTGTKAKDLSTRTVLISKGNSTEEYKRYENGEVVYFDVETGLKCTNYNEENSATGYNGIDNRTGNQNSCLKFYAFNDDGGNTVNLILDHNTTATSLWNSSGNNSVVPTDTLEQLKSDTQNWKGTIEPLNYTTGITGRKYTIDYQGFNARLITSNEIGKITGNIGWDENVTVDDVAFYFDSSNDKQSSTCKVGDISGCKYGWLYDRTSTDCETEGCFNNAEVDISGYWTASPSAMVSVTEIHQTCDGYVVYGTSHHGRMGKTCPDYPDHYGVRPVIEVNKSDLETINSTDVCVLADGSKIAAGLYAQDGTLTYTWAELIKNNILYVQDGIVDSYADEEDYATNSVNNITGSLIIPNSIIGIGAGTFAYTANLNEVVVPKSVVNIGEATFAHSGIDRLYYVGSEEEWNNISFGEDWDLSAGGFIVEYNYSG